MYLNLLVVFKQRMMVHYNIFRKKIILILFILFGFLSSNNLYSQIFFSPVSNNIQSTQTSGHKPQSKVWYYGSYWWAVIPVAADGGDPAGTYLWRLDGNTLTKTIKLSDYNNTWADAKVSGGVTHILLQREGSNFEELVSIEFVSGSPPTYKFWTTRPANVSITVDANSEASTIDIDSQGRMWLASDGNTTVNVRWSDSPYDTWSSAIVLNSGHNIVFDDLCAVTAFDGDKIGVLWSNQSEDEFQFKYHLDSESDPTIWSSLEVPISGGGVADDHINFATGSDGTIYAAIKTSYNDSRTNIGLLVRRTSTVDSDNWENLHTVTTGNAYASRPIALWNQVEDKIIVLYQQPESGGDIDYKYSNTDVISFGSEMTLDDQGRQDLTSTKQSISNEVLILYNLDGSTDEFEYWYGNKANASPFPVELSLFNAILFEDKVKLDWRTETETNNYGFEIERMIEDSEWERIGFVEGHGNSNSPKDYTYTDQTIEISGKYYYRLKQIDNDGEFEYSDIVSINSGTPDNYYLSQNYPNPFNPTTTIEFSLPERQLVILRIYNTLGEAVIELVNEITEPGNHSVTLDASELPSGTYFYTISAGNYYAVKKMTLLK